MNYKDERATMPVIFRPTRTWSWDKIYQNRKSQLKLMQSAEKSVILEYKTRNTATERSYNVSLNCIKTNLVSSSDINSSQVAKSPISVNVSALRRPILSTMIYLQASEL